MGKKMCGPKILGPKIFCPKIEENKSRSQKFEVQKMLSTKIKSCKNLGPKTKVKITRCTTTSERKQVFASKSKFQIESVKIEPTFALVQDILTRRLGFLNS